MIMPKLPHMKALTQDCTYIYMHCSNASQMIIAGDRELHAPPPAHILVDENNSDLRSVCEALESLLDVTNSSVCRDGRRATLYGSMNQHCLHKWNIRPSRSATAVNGVLKASSVHANIPAFVCVHTCVCLSVFVPVLVLFAFKVGVVSYRSKLHTHACLSTPVQLHLTNLTVASQK